MGTIFGINSFTDNTDADPTKVNENFNNIISEINGLLDEDNIDLDKASFRAALLVALKAVDGAGSGLDADLLDGQSGDYYFDTAAESLVKIKTVDGTLSGLDSDLLDGKHYYDIQDWVNAKDYGSIGDGVTDDTISIINAIKKARQEDSILYFPSGDYLINYSSIPVEEFTALGDYLPACSMTGYNAKLILDGNIGFDTTDMPFLIIENINFELRNNYRDDTENFDGVNRLFFGNNTINNARRIYRNINAYGIVGIEDGTQRYRGFIREHNITNNSIFRDIEINNFAYGIDLHDSENFIIDNYNSYNFQTAIWTSECLNYKVHNILAENTFDQSQIWVSKNHLTDPDLFFNGMDLILCSGDNYSLHNLNAINPIERCVYSSGSNIRASKLKSVNGGGFKFVGSEGNISKNIKVNDTYMIVDRDLTGTVSSQFSHARMYYVENIEISNVKIDITGDFPDVPILSVFSLADHVKNLKIENVNCNGGLQQSLLYVALKSENGLIAEDYIVAENISVKNCRIAKNNRKEGSLLNYRIAEASIDAKNNYASRNIRIENCSINYTGVDIDDFWYNYSYTDGFYAENNNANVQTTSLTGLGAFRPVKPYNNIVIKEENIKFSSDDELLSNIKNIDYLNLSSGSKLTFTTEGVNDNHIDFKLYMLADGETPVKAYNNSNIKMIYNASMYIAHSNLPDNYIIEQKVTDGYYLGKVQGSTITDIIGTPIINISSASTGQLIIRGDTYSGKGKILIESSPI